MIDAASLDEIVTAAGLLVVGGFAPTAEDGVPPRPDGEPAASVVVLGSAGPQFWRSFRSRMPDGPHPLDRWTRSTVQELAGRCEAAAVFPFDGPPHLPFQRWARLADPRLHPSPIGLLIHPEHGLWLGLRAALLFAQPLAIAPWPAARSPCDDCVARPCLSTCPVGAFRADRYVVPDCLAYLATLSGQPCMTLGCAARRACPVGRTQAQLPEQAQLHMRAFRADAGTRRG